MDVSQQVDSIVEGLVRGIEARLENRVESVITKFLDTQLENYDYENKINWLASLKLDSIISGIEINKSGVERRLDDVTNVVIENIQADCLRMARDHVSKKLYNDIDVHQLVRSLVSEELAKYLTTFAFPDNSIPGRAVTTDSLLITGDNLRGGVIKEFNSSGIQDMSSQVQMTLLDTAVVIENQIVALALTVKGSTLLEGDVVINGTIPPESHFYKGVIENAVAGVKESMDSAFFGDYSTVIFDKIKEEGLDLNRITLNGSEVIIGNKLNYTITDTNIQRVGRVLDLQTVGESYLSESLYVGKNRVGINTISPGHSLSIWDQEIEIGFGKQKKDVAWLGTSRNQNLVLSSNNNDNIILHADGTVAVKSITVNNVTITSSPGNPTADLPRGTVSFNETPSAGQPVGWISLGNGSWSSFGTVD